MMNVKEAVQTAKEHVVDLFDGEDIDFVGLEEVVFDDESNHWLITIGFSRPWDRPKTLSAALREEPLRRSYKTVHIDDADGRVISLKDRILTVVE
jgi:hypothetical protein